MPPEGTAALRCLLCGERGARETDRRLRYRDGTTRDFALTCPSCGLLTEAGLDPVDGRRLLDRLLAEPVFEAGRDDPFGLDAYTLRSAASAVMRGIAPCGPEQAAALRTPHSPLAAHAALVDLSAQRGVEIAIGVLCREHEARGLSMRLARHASWAREIVVLVDSEPRAPQTLVVEGFPSGAARCLSRPLAGDFAAQRNALQDSCASGWVLQLDADEHLAEATGALLPALAARCGAEGVVSIGLARCNRVDGVLSDLFPDVQYRLNRREVRYAGRVHERPARDWRSSMIALHGAIEHDLARDHVLARSARYDALDPGRGRLEETDRLLAPYRA